MSTGIITPLDAAQQEKVRRGSHKYAPDPNRNGMYTYQPEGYQHQEYPKMMLRAPRPQFKEFRKRLLAQQAGDNELNQLLLGQKLDMQALYDAATREWDEEAQASVVKNKAEEEAWLAANPQEEPKVVVSASAKERAQQIKAEREAKLAEHPVEKVRRA